ncbi:DoxX family membrane protein [Nocardia cyriacigeorgica]|uniref:DoxX family membrane protein n=1 Tax=Nocardia cyriacigeorgica TaxID=135487 RepID=A0A5R8NXR3_9NOCA|nr:DoxX family membrane protein [Nocardia cyriacigeorgica]TLF81087.1 DoxX family membrane protein [Nocardia cyriacigeorgica]
MANTQPADLSSDTSARLKYWSAATLFARLALGVGFLSAVADRFGLWGRPGTNNVAWGTFDAFTAYVDDLAPYLPDLLIDITAWASTAAELALGLALLLGLALHWTALAGFATLLAFGGSMFFFSGPESALNASVFSAAAAAALLALSPERAHIVSLDRLLRTSPAGGDLVNTTAG